MIFIEAPQGSPEWFQARVGKITASCFADAVSITTRTVGARKAGDPTAASDRYAADLAIERISGKPHGEPPKAWVLERGHEMEVKARMLYEARTGAFITESGICISDDGIFGYSSDGLAGDDGLIEIKAPIDSTKIIAMWQTGDTSEYDHQIQGGLWLTGRRWLDFIMYVPDLAAAGKDLYVKRIQRDEPFIDTLVAGLAAFDQRVRGYVAMLAAPIETSTMETAVTTPEPTAAPAPDNRPVVTVELEPVEDIAPITQAAPPTLRLGHITERLGFTVTADFMLLLGFAPAATDKAAKLYHESDFPLICAALLRHITAVQAKHATTWQSPAPRRANLERTMNIENETALREAIHSGLECLLNPGAREFEDAGQAFAEAESDLLVLIRPLIDYPQEQIAALRTMVDELTAEHAAKAQVALTDEVLGKMLRKAYNFGQTYWQQADSEYMSQQRKSSGTAAKFAEFVTESCAALAPSIQALPVTDTGLPELRDKMHAASQAGETITLSPQAAAAMVHAMMTGVPQGEALPVVAAAAPDAQPDLSKLHRYDWSEAGGYFSPNDGSYVLYDDLVELLAVAQPEAKEAPAALLTPERIEWIAKNIYGTAATDQERAFAAALLLAAAGNSQDAKDAAQGWISVAERLPEVDVLVMVYSPPNQYDSDGDIHITFDYIDPNDDDHASWYGHNEFYEHFCCVSKPEGSVGPSEKAPYTHWMPLPAAPVAAPSPAEGV